MKRTLITASLACMVAAWCLLIGLLIADGNWYAVAVFLFVMGACLYTALCD